jgi:hypothetical protein
MKASGQQELRGGVTSFMRKLAACLILSMLSGSPPSFSAASPEQHPTSAPSRDPGFIQGSVVAADTGLPIRDGLVVLTPAGGPHTMRVSIGCAIQGCLPSGPSTEIDDDGRFTFSGVPPGHYRIVAIPGPAARQYLQSRYPDGETDGAPFLSIGDQGILGDILIRLPRAAVIAGRVLGDGSSPLADVMVSASPVLPGRGQGRVTVLGSRTDDTGAFRIFGLTPGEYLVRAGAMGHTADDHEGGVRGCRRRISGGRTAAGALLRGGSAP